MMRGRESRAFNPTAGIDQAPRADGRVLNAEQRGTLDLLSLGYGADRAALRRRYAELVRKYHPDRNGGNRNFEARLQAVVEAYQMLRLIF